MTSGADTLVGPLRWNFFLWLNTEAPGYSHPHVSIMQYWNGYHYFCSSMMIFRFFTRLKLLHFVPFILNFCLRILLKQYLTSFSKKSYFRSRIKFPILITYTIYSISKRLVMVYGCCCLSIRSIDSILALSDFGLQSLWLRKRSVSELDRSTLKPLFDDQISVFLV